MITIGQEHHLGNKARFFMILEAVCPSLFIIFVVWFLSLASSFLTEQSASFLNVFGQISLFANYTSQSLLTSFAVVIILIALLLAFISVLIALLRYHFFTYRIGEFDLRLKKGILNIQEITIPYRQMQNVDIVRNIVYRIFGISKLVIMSAGHDEDPSDEATTNTVFSPIDHNIGDEIRTILERRIGIQIIQDTEKTDRQEMEEEELAKQIGNR